MAYKITATLQAGHQEPTKITMFRDVKVTESEIKKIYKDSTVSDYKCEVV